jgi:hypothetical protein
MRFAAKLCRRNGGPRAVRCGASRSGMESDRLDCVCAPGRPRILADAAMARMGFESRTEPRNNGHWLCRWHCEQHRRQIATWLDCGRDHISRPHKGINGECRDDRRRPGPKFIGPGYGNDSRSCRARHKHESLPGVPKIGTRAINGSMSESRQRPQAFLQRCFGAPMTTASIAPQ